MSDLMDRAVNLVEKIVELELLKEELRHETYGGNGDSHWPDPDVQLGKHEKKYKDEVGIHVKNQANYELSKTVDRLVRSATGSVNAAIFKLNLRLRPEKQSE